MKKNELAAMTIAELKALAVKKKIALPARAKKADIVTILATAVSAPAKKVVKAAIRRSAAQGAKKVLDPSEKKKTI